MLAGAVIADELPFLLFCRCYSRCVRVSYDHLTLSDAHSAILPLSWSCSLPRKCCATALANLQTSSFDVDLAGARGRRERD
jgi:hypothetical protein